MNFWNKFKGENKGDHQQSRERMVEQQLRGRGIKNEAVLESMLTVPRHEFVPERLRKQAYADKPLPIGEGQTISQPYIVALMVAALDPQPTDKVLEVGTGFGYAAAVLAQIVAEVYTVERFESLAQEAERRYANLNYQNVEVKVGDGSQGWLENAPYQGIVVSAAAPSLPESLVEQLDTGGRLVIPVGERSVQSLLRVSKKNDGKLLRENLCRVRFVPLLGEEGWNDDS
ncbi:protein-L-isoaspartate(D-aspartate) O-methyltransferase [Fuchsiella alkaliacetigena]|uniref:protein-L-isoaspartate(D-aspartate) O-methyltransferase n=1 Tax=Fuchsiella alkaliacetigena TaxID=957042 RepID=UPI002009E5D4|nr:protein-L-isoaspartate(D-aspartate) O-methyltransferase [Fuchsiella alkaliacetigena]MCK8824657.1 protein-L-isoaspartate(D-aspartate) O-methyltransferase [Fuchsiella alkaliacetigena]